MAYILYSSVEGEYSEPFPVLMVMRCWWQDHLGSPDPSCSITAATKPELQCHVANQQLGHQSLFQIVFLN